MPLTSLKIDRVFVNDICSDENDQNIVQTVISMAHSMGIKVVAEGVETHEQFELLSKSAVDEIQGYLIGKPVAPEALEKLILIPDKRLPLQKKSADAILTFADDNDPVIVYKAAVVE